MLSEKIKVETMRKSTVFILILCLISVAVLAGCTSENHRVLITVSNNRDLSQNIRLHIDGAQKFTATIEPDAGVEREFELSKGDHTFELYHQVNGTFTLYKTETMYVEADSSLFFELE
jgi:hypothetical protein